MSLLSYFQKKKRPAGEGPATGPIGFHLSNDKLHLIQLEKHGDGMRLRSGLSAAYPESRESLLSSPGDFKAFVKSSLKADSSSPMKL